MTLAILKRTALALCAVLALTLTHGAGRSSASGFPAVGFAAAPDLSSEDRTLATYIQDLKKFQRRAAELGKKESLTPNEVDSLQQSSDDLKRRLSSVQNAIRSIITKLKASGDWDGLDSTLAARITNPKVPGFHQTSFKQRLEKESSELNNSANEISDLITPLRRKIAAADSASPPVDYAPLSLGLRIIQAGYEADPMLSRLASLGCRLAHIRYGISGFVHKDGPTVEAEVALACACFEDPTDPDCSK